MAGLLDILTGGGGLLGGLPAPNDPAWAAIRARLAQGGGGLPDRGSPGINLSEAPPPVSMSDITGALGGAFSGLRNAIVGGMSKPGFPMDISGSGLSGQIPDPFGYGAQPQSLYGVNPSGFGFQPPPGPGPVPYPPTAPQGPSAAAPSAPASTAPVSLLENRPPTSGTSRGTNVPNTVAPVLAPQRQTASQDGLQFGSQAIGDRLGSAFQNFIQTRDPIVGIGNAIIGATTGQRTDPVGAYQQNAQQTYQALRSAGYSHADAALAATNPEVLKTIVTNAYQQPKFEKAGPGEAAFLVGGGQGRLGPGGGGPSGVSGAGVTQLTPGMTVQEKAAQEAAGQKQGQLAATLPATLSSADNALAVIKTIQEHPGRNSFFSYGIGAKAPVLPGSPEYDYRAAVSQLKSQAFLAAFNTLRGGGQISNTEGEKATEAMAQLDIAQSQQARDKAISTLRSIIETGRENVIKEAQGRTEPFATPQQPAAQQPQSSGGWTNVAPNIRVRPKQ